MRRTLLGLFILTFGWMLAAAAQQGESVDALKLRIEHASPGDQIKLSLELAEAQLQHLDDLYKAGDDQNALHALEDVESYGVRAANTSADTRKHMKPTEIAVRKLSYRLSEIARNVDLEQRAPVKAAVTKLDKAHDDLLNRMFAKK
jgi:hypothetical protein